MTSTEVITLFERDLRSAKGAANNTVAAYLQELKGLAKYLAGIGKDLLTAGYDDFLSWRESLAHRAPHGLNVARCAARSFYNFCAERAILTPNPFPNLRIKCKRQEPTAMPTAKQFLAMRARLQGEMPKVRIDKLTRLALIEMLAGSGLRIEALLTMQAKHLYLGVHRPHIKVDREMSCKGHFAGTIPLSPYAAKVLSQYLLEHPAIDGKPVFAVAKATVRSLLRLACPEVAGIVPHSLRHFYCSMTYFKNFDGGKNDLIWVRDAAGHSNVAITDIYTKLARGVASDKEWEAWALGK